MDYWTPAPYMASSSKLSSSEMRVSFSQDMDNEYEKLIRRMNPPRVVIENESCNSATLIQVDSANRHGILLDVVQVLTDLNLIIRKAYISSDGGWFMDVFHVTNQDGSKVTDEEVLDFIQKSLGPESSSLNLNRSVGVESSSPGYTSIELLGRDRPGLLSELSAVLTHLKCNVVNAEVWTHNTRAAAVMQINDQETGSSIDDPEKLLMIRQLLSNVLKGSDRSREAKTAVSHDSTHTERRLHQMMFADRDYECVITIRAGGERLRSLMMASSTVSCSFPTYQFSNIRISRLQCPTSFHPYHGMVYQNMPTRKPLVAQFKVRAAADGGKFQQILIIKERLSKFFQDSTKEFPWKKAKDILVNPTLHVGKTVLAWSFIGWFGLAFISDVALSISQNRELLMPIGLLAGCALTEFIKETSVDAFGDSNEENDLKWHLVGIGGFFLLLRLISLCFPIGGRVLLLHVTNGGLMQILWLWRTAVKET